MASRPRGSGRPLDRGTAETLTGGQSQGLGALGQTAFLLPWETSF